MRWTRKQIVRHALERAIEYEYTYLDAVGGETPEGKDTYEMIKRFRRVLEIMTGSRKTLAEVLDDELMRNTKMIGAHEVTKVFIDSQGSDK